MPEHHLGRGVVYEYISCAYPGFIRDGESNLQLPFYYRDGRYLTAPYDGDEPSFTQTNEIIQDNRRYLLREPRAGDELVYRTLGSGALQRISQWTFAEHYDAMRLTRYNSAN